MTSNTAKSELDAAIEILELQLDRIEGSVRVLEAQREAVKEKLYQLHLAKQVLAEIGDSDQRDQPKGSDSSERSETLSSARRRRRMRPGVATQPTLGEILLEYFDSQDVCAKAGEVYRDLRSKPEVRSQNSVNTTLSRLVKSGKLVSTKDGYKLRKDEEPGAATSGSPSASSNTAVRADADAGGANQRGG